jgi:hypothetical protein
VDESDCAILIAYIAYKDTGHILPIVVTIDKFKQGGDANVLSNIRISIETNSATAGDI